MRQRQELCRRQDGERREWSRELSNNANRDRTESRLTLQNGSGKADVEEEEEEPKPKSKATKGKTEKSKAAPVSKPDNQAPVDDGESGSLEVDNRNCTWADHADPLSQNPECVKVKDWRHKLQRAFLGKSLPTADVRLDSF